jgi:hypothetical protein
VADDIPDEVLERMTGVPRRPELDPTLGIAVAAPDAPAAPHRLVAVGDSLTHGFRSLAVYDTQNSYPAMIARALGIEGSFRLPGYDLPDGFGGIPLNLEWLLRGIEDALARVDEPFRAFALFRAAAELLSQHGDYWESGRGAAIPPRDGPILHDLAVYGFDLRDALSRTADDCLRELAGLREQPLDPMPAKANQLATLRVLNTARAGGRALTQLEAAAALGAEGIETLIVFLGANNALASVASLNVVWSGPDFQDPARKNRYTVWRPSHFQAELELVVEQVRAVGARHVLWLTIPHVTIAPIAHGVGGFVAPRSAYFAFYVRPWASTGSPLLPHITGRQAEAIDTAIDAYNEGIVDAVGGARRDGLDWALVDVCGVLDRLAFRRYLERPEATPPWWDEVGGPYELPGELVRALGFTPDTRFLRSQDGRVTEGGIVGLDGVHPTTSGYSIVAHECVRALRALGVQAGEIAFADAARADTLCTRPLSSLSGDLQLLGELDGTFHVLGILERAMRVFKG